MLVLWTICVSGKGLESMIKSLPTLSSLISPKLLLQWRHHVLQQSLLSTFFFCQKDTCLLTADILFENCFARGLQRCPCHSTALMCFVVCHVQDGLQLFHRMRVSGHWQQEERIIGQPQSSGTLYDFITYCFKANLPVAFFFGGLLPALALLRQLLSGMQSKYALWAVATCCSLLVYSSPFTQMPSGCNLSSWTAVIKRLGQKLGMAHRFLQSGCSRFLTLISPLLLPLMNTHRENWSYLNPNRCQDLFLKECF